MQPLVISGWNVNYYRRRCRRLAKPAICSRCSYKTRAAYLGWLAIEAPTIIKLSQVVMGSALTADHGSRRLP